MMYQSYDIVVIGSSAGGLAALALLLSGLFNNFRYPVVLVQHLHPEEYESYAVHLDTETALHVKEAGDKELVRPGTVYCAPADYHILLGHDGTISLSVDEKVNYSRPSIDVLFESAAYVYGSRSIGIILTGANDDGARGLGAIKKAGGLAVVQSPETAYCDTMPRAAIESTEVDYILPIEEISALLNTIWEKNNE
jgi:two-component system chemotaxis response regulator CheB